MPQKLEQYLKEVEGLFNNGLKTDSNTLQSLKDMQKEMNKRLAGFVDVYCNVGGVEAGLGSSSQGRGRGLD